MVPTGTLKICDTMVVVRRQNAQLEPKGKITSGMPLLGLNRDDCVSIPRLEGERSEILVVNGTRAVDGQGLKQKAA